MRFQKRIKLFPGVMLNLSRSGITTSIGPKGAKINIGRGSPKVTVGLPGTGLSHTQSLVEPLSKRVNATQKNPVEASQSAPKSNRTIWVLVGLLLMVWLVFR